MKHIVNKNYKDLKLHRRVVATKEEVLEDIYAEAGIELTEERIKLLVEDKKLYRVVEDTTEDEEVDTGKATTEAEEEVEVEPEEDTTDTEEVEEVAEEVTDTLETEEQKENKNKNAKANKKTTTKK